MRDETASKMFEEPSTEGRKFLFEHEAKTLCSLYGMPVTRIMVAKTEEEAVNAATEIGFEEVSVVLIPSKPSPRPEDNATARAGFLMSKRNHA